MEQDLIDHLLNKIVLFIDNIGLIAPVNDVRTGNRKLGRDFLILLQQFNGVPTTVTHLRILFF